MLGPIFAREFLTVPRRPRHYVSRSLYIAALWILALTTWLATFGWSRTATLGETARFGPLLFQLMTSVQMALFLFFSALSTASAIALEKDRRTFILLMMTDLRDRELVLGKLLGSLLPILALLAATFPMLMFIVLLGGVSVQQVIQAFLVMASTTLVAGSLGALIALWRDRTFQSLALTVLFIVLYLCLVRGLGLFFAPETTATSFAGFWPQWVDPFWALESAQQFTKAGATSLAPAYVYSAVMLVMSLSLIGGAIVGLRKWNPSGEPIMQREKIEAAKEEKLEERKEPLPDSIHAAPGALRKVGKNPILWREIFTRAYGKRPVLVKTAYFVVLAFICYYALAPVIAGERSTFAAAYGLIPVGVLSLLLITAQAITAVTTERDTGSLDLLLVTDLSPKEFVFGKIGGILFNSKEYLLPPLILAGVYAYYHCLATPPAKLPQLAGTMNFTALVCVLGGMLVLMGFAVTLGMHIALRRENSRVAVLHGLSTIFFLSVGTLICIALIIINGQFEYQWTSFIFFLVAGVGGLWWVLNSGRPSTALSWAAWFCPLAMLYSVMNVLVAKPGSVESADPILPFLVITFAFGFTIAAMLVPLLSEFDVALGRTSGGAD